MSHLFDKSTKRQYKPKFRPALFVLGKGKSANEISKTIVKIFETKILLHFMKLKKY